MGLSSNDWRGATRAEIDRTKNYLADYATVTNELLAAAPQPAAAAPATDVAATPAKPVPANPDEADQTDEPVVEEVIQASNATAAAWASFCQALVGSAEFRYLK